MHRSRLSTTVRNTNDVRHAYTVSRRNGEVAWKMESSSMTRRSRNIDSAPEPPWRATERGEPRIPLTRDAVVEAAVRVLERGGVDALSMRRVAEEIGTGAASLYGHIRDKEELL